MRWLGKATRVLIMRALRIGALLGPAMCPGVGAAAATPPATDDPVELARWADHVGPATVLSFLRPEAPALVRLRAIGAAPALSAPEQALLPLAPLIAGRDPDLAPAAARAAMLIARAVALERLQSREVSSGLLSANLRAYRQLAATGGLRPDIALMVEQVMAQLRDLAAVHPGPAVGRGHGP